MDGASDVSFNHSVASVHRFLTSRFCLTPHLLLGFHETHLSPEKPVLPLPLTFDPPGLLGP